MVKAKKIVQLVHPFAPGLPKETDFKLIEEELEPLKDGEFLIQVEYVTVDPYLRIEARDAAREAGQVGKVIESKNAKFPVGTSTMGYLGWTTHSIVSDPSKGFLYALPPQLEKFPKSYGLSVLGMPGMTAYFGFLECCTPKEGETVVVSTAAGAVGCLVGQIAKIKGCKVIGYTGSDEKVEWVKSLGFDHVYNYKKVSLEDSLKEAAPDGIDCYFDNVGGEFASTVVAHMKLRGRICCCGAITQYNEDRKIPSKATCIQLPMIGKRLQMTGFLVSDRFAQFPEGIKQMATWIAEGKLKYRETIYKGIENTPKAFISMLQGENIGKAVVQI